MLLIGITTTIVLDIGLKNLINKNELTMIYAKSNFTCQKDSVN